MAKSSVLLFIGLFVGHSCLVEAHDLPASKDVHWNPERTRFPDDPAPSSVRPTGHSLAPAFIVVLPNRWAVGQTLHVCFYGGSPAIRARILKTAATWLSSANLKFDTGGTSGQSCAPSGDKSEVRIGFNEPGYWSYIGNDSMSADLVGKSSVNFQGFDTAPIAEPRFTGVVLHEFGHALGFHHEHQSPAEGCDKEYNWPKLYTFYKQNYGWDQAMVDQNLKQLQADRSAYDWSRPDPSSIMVYESDPRFLYKGTGSTCYFHTNNVLSSLDKQGAETTYPMNDVHPQLSSQETGLKALIATFSTKESRLKDALVRQLELTQDALKAH